MRTFQQGLLIESPDENPIAVIEVKSRRNIPHDLAIIVRSSMLERGLPAHVPYFLLLSPDTGFLWKGDLSLSADSPPDYEFPMNSVITRYSKGEPEKWLYKSTLELLILHWLTNLSSKPQAMVEEPEKTLARAGFTDAIKDAMVLMGDTL